MSVAFQEDPPRIPHPAEEDEGWLLDIDGFEGPIDLLLAMARDQKVDLRQISVLQLARQYLGFIERARSLRIELAAEYLVMAAWLAYLKSRLLLPRQEEDNEPDAQSVADALHFQLRRLGAIRDAAERLFALPRLGQNIFARGMAEGLRTRTATTFELSLIEMLRVYGDIEKRREISTYALPVYHLMSLDAAMDRLTRMLGELPRASGGTVWAELKDFAPPGLRDRLYARSVLSSLLTASLELVKQGRLELRQDEAFRPIYLKGRI